MHSWLVVRMRVLALANLLSCVITYPKTRRLLAFTLLGDHGREILELLRKNPAGAIPTIVQRMKAKDMEWRRVRAELRKGWNEVLHKHYYKALDYQSNSFRQVRSVCVSVC